MVCMLQNFLTISLQETFIFAFNKQASAVKCTYLYIYVSVLGLECITVVVLASTLARAVLYLK